MAMGLLLKQIKEVNKVIMLPLSEIVSNPHQPRKHFDDDALQELSRSIVANGLLQPITVRSLEWGGYELIAGERRTLAFRMLGREYIPAIVEEYTDQQSAVLALIENMQRKDLNYFEEAPGISKLMEQLGLTQQQISVRLGKAQSTVANKLRLLRYPPSLQAVMLQAGLTERHARALLGIQEMEMLESAVAHVIKNGCTVEQTEQYVNLLMEKKECKGPIRMFVVKDMRMFHNSIIKAVNMMNLAGIQVENKKRENDEYIEYIIKIPKASVYKERARGPQARQKRLEIV